VARQRRTLAGRLRRRSRPTTAFTDRLDTAAPTRPESSRPKSAPPPVFILPPGESRYQRRSAHLPSGVAAFKGLGAEPEITVDLTEVDAELAAEKD